MSLLASWLQINGSEQAGWNSVHLSACHVLWWSKVSYKCPWPFQRQRTGFPVWYCRSHYEPCDPLWWWSSTTGFEYKIYMKNCIATCGLSFFLIYLRLPWRMIPAGLLNLASLSPVSNVATCFLTFSECQMWLALRKSLFKGDSAILLWIEFLLRGPTMNECLPPLDTSCSFFLGVFKSCDAFYNLMSNLLGWSAGDEMTRIIWQMIKDKVCKWCSYNFETPSFRDSNILNYILNYIHYKSVGFVYLLTVFVGCLGHSNSRWAMKNWLIFNILKTRKWWRHYGNCL